MNQHDFLIRLETPADYAVTENLAREAFWNVYRPGCLEHYVLHTLRHDPAFLPALAFVMEQNGQIIGQIIAMRAQIAADDGRQIPILTMGPLSIAPERQRSGYGKALLDATLDAATALGFGAVCFEGDLNVYGKSGFTHAARFGLRYHGLPEGADASFFLCKELRPGYLTGITGEYTTPAGYFVSEAEAEAFDAQFPPKEKKVLPGQLT